MKEEKKNASKTVTPCTHINHPTHKASCNIGTIIQPQNPWLALHIANIKIKQENKENKNKV